MMRAVLQRSYGAPSRALAIEEIARPDVGADQVLVRVVASSINSLDCRAVRADPVLVRFIGGFRRPKDPAFGVDAAGIVEQVGENVTDLKPGDQVYGTGSGAVAEYAAGKRFAPKPKSISMEQAAAVPVAACTALMALRDQGNVQPGQSVLINGAGGGVGSFAVQIACAFGAEVTAVTSADKTDFVSTLGARRVLDRARDDFTKMRGAFDLIVDIGGDRSLGSSLQALKPAGRLVIVGAHKRVLRRLMIGTLRRKLFKQPIVFFVAAVRPDDLVTLGEMIDQGKVRPVIARTFPMDQTADAVAYAEGQQAPGKVVVQIAAA